MARTQTVAAQFEETRTASTTGGGTSLSTTEAYVPFVPGTNWFSASPRNFSAAVVAKVALCPYLVILKSTDNLATAPVDASLLLQDGDNTVTLVLNSFDTLANKNALYLGSHTPFAGLFVDVQNANGNTSTIAVHYYNGGQAPSTLTATDNTASGGASFAIDGTITWTTPTDWVPASLLEAFRQTTTTFNRIGASIDYSVHQPLFWVRLSFSAAFDSTTSLNQVIALPRGANYEELISGQSWEQSVRNRLFGYSGLAAKTDAGTANIVVDCACYGKFFAVAPAAL